MRALRLTPDRIGRRLGHRLRDKAQGLDPQYTASRATMTSISARNHFFPGRTFAAHGQRKTDAVEHEKALHRVGLRINRPTEQSGSHSNCQPIWNQTLKERR